MLAIFSAPIAIAKTFISLIHGAVASMNITSIDAREREAMMKKKDEEKKST